MKKRLLSLVLCLVMAFSLVPFAASAEYKAPVTANGATITNPNTAYTTRRDLVLDKTLTANADGTFDLKLESYATGKVTTSVVTTQIPTDFILVVDQSGSMAYQDMPTDFQPANHTGSWKLSDFEGGKDVDGNSADKEYYFLDQNTGDYYRVYRKWGDVFERVPRNTVYCKSIVDSRNLTWFADEKGTESDFDSQYYYQPASDINITRQCATGAYIQPGGENDYNFYPLTISSQGRTLYYSIRLNYYDSTGTKRYLRFTNNNANTTANKNKETGACIWYRNPSGGYFGPGDRYLAIMSYNSGIGIDANDFVIDWIDGNANWDSFYTYGQITSLVQSGMYIQNTMFIRHVNYNALAYRDANGVEHIIASTDYCNGQGTPTADQFATDEFSFDVQLYEAKGDKETRLQATKNALTAFVDNVAKQTDDNGPVDHRVAIIGFSSPNYSNTELMTNEGWTASNNTGIASPSTQQYQKALISARADDNGTVNSALTAAITNLTANGGTQPEDGLNMAYNTLNNSTKKAEYSAKTRNAVVIFFTDGRPGNYHDVDQYKEANDVVASAWNIKRDFAEAQIYSVGVFGEADGNPLTYYKALSTWYGDVTRNYMEKDRLEEDRVALGAGSYVYSGSGYADPDDYYNYRDYAENIYEPEFYKEDGTHTTVTVRYSSRSYGRGTISYVPAYTHRISGTYWRECLRNTVGYPAQQNDTIADYMTVVSSTYPSAKTFTYRSGSTDGFRYYTGTSSYNTIIGNARGDAVNKMYYSLCTDSDRLTEVFVNIAESIDTAGSTIDLDGSAQLRDIVNTDVFEMPADASKVTAYAVSASAENRNGNIIYSFGTDHVANFTPNTTDGTVSVSGFDYSSHYVMENPPEGITGQKLIVEIKGLTLKDGVDGEALSNNEAGIYATKQEDGQTVISTEPTLAIDSPKLSISGAVNPTYVIDFNAPMTVATGAKQVNQIERKDGTAANGEFNLNGTTATYQLKSDETIVGGANISLSGVDSAMVYGVPVNVTGASVAWNKITTVPASSVYFDDDLTTALPVGDGHGYANVQASSPENATAAGDYTFTFNGTGIDIYCTTTTNGGYVQAVLDGGGAGKVQTIKNYAVNERYNTPTISFRGLSADTEHTLVLHVLNNANYKLDGVRIYKPVAEDYYTGDAANEANASYTNLRTLLVNDNANGFTYAEGSATGGLLYLDDASKVAMEQLVTNEDGSPKMVDGQQVTERVFATDYEGYKANSPKNEIYLAQGQGIAFTVTGYSGLNDTAKKNIYVGLSTPKTETATVKFRNVENPTDSEKVTISSGVDMYYQITPAGTSNDGDTATFVIINTSSAVVSVTNFKISGNNAPVNVVAGGGAVVMSVAENDDQAAAEPVTLRMLVNRQTLNVLANLQDESAGTDIPDEPDTPDVPDTPDTPDQPDDPTPTQTPTIHNIIQQIFSSFVNSLFKSISRLFR